MADHFANATIAILGAGVVAIGFLRGLERWARYHAST